MELITNNLFCELSVDEMAYIDGGKSDNPRDPSNRKPSTSSEESQDAAISYTLGYLSIATCWCAPVSLFFGIVGTLWSIK